MPSGIEHLCEKFLPKSQPSRPVALQEAAVIQEWESVGGAAESGWHGGDQQMNSAMLTTRNWKRRVGGIASLGRRFFPHALMPFLFANTSESYSDFRGGHWVDESRR